MAWEKPSPELIERFDTWLPADQRVERRQMFGCACAFVNGNMFAGVYRQSVVVRLAQATREELIATQRGQPFTVNGRTMREYALLADALARQEADTVSLIAKAFAFASGLPTKEKASSKSPSTKRTSGRRR